MDLIHGEAFTMGTDDRLVVLVQRQAAMCERTGRSNVRARLRRRFVPTRDGQTGELLNRGTEIHLAELCMGRIGTPKCVVARAARIGPTAVMAASAARRFDSCRVQGRGAVHDTIFEF